MNDQVFYPLQTLGEEKLEALVELMYLAAAADGEFSAIEQQHFLTSIESLTDGRLSGDRLEALLGKARSELESTGRAARLDAVKARLPDRAARKAALALAIQVTAADGVIRQSECELILDTAKALDIPAAEAESLLRLLSPRKR